MVEGHCRCPGCGECPLLLGDSYCGMYTHPWTCGATGEVLPQHDPDEEPPPAPSTCRLRTGPVVVEAPAKEEP